MRQVIRCLVCGEFVVTRSWNVTHCKQCKAKDDYRRSREQSRKKSEERECMRNLTPDAYCCDCGRKIEPTNGRQRCPDCAYDRSIQMDRIRERIKQDPDHLERAVLARLEQLGFKTSDQENDDDTSGR
jgi:Zn finger protein HypA/HybF involved in hydrogenase expression